MRLYHPFRFRTCLNRDTKLCNRFSRWDKCPAGSQRRRARTGSPLADKSGMPASRPFSSALHEKFLGRDSLHVLPPPAIPTLLETHLGQLRSFYQVAPTAPTKGGRFYRKLLAEYYRDLIPATASVLEIGCGGGHLLKLLPNRDVVGVDIAEKQIVTARALVPKGEFHVMAGEDLELDRKFDVVVLSETVNFAADVQRILEKVHAVSHSGTRLILNFHSGLWRPLLGLATALGIRAEHPPCNWLSSTDMRNMLGLAGWEVLKQQGRLLMTLPCFGLEKLINRFIAPVLSQLGLTVFQVARPVQKPLGEKNRLSRDPSP